MMYLLKLFHIGANVQFLSEARPVLRVQVPITLRNLHHCQFYPRKHSTRKSRKGSQERSERGGAKQRTASGSILPSSTPPFTTLSLPQGVSIPPSMTASATCTPFGPNSRASDWARARWANFAAAKVLKRAEPRTEAVAPVTRRVGGWGDEETAERRRGIVFWAKMKKPLLFYMG